MEDFWGPTKRLLGDANFLRKLVSYNDDDEEVREGTYPINSFLVMEGLDIIFFSCHGDEEREEGRRLHDEGSER